MPDIDRDFQTTIRVTETLKWLLTIQLLLDLGLNRRHLYEGFPLSRSLKFIAEQLRSLQPGWY